MWLREIQSPNLIVSQLGLDYVDLYLIHAPEKLFPKGGPSQEEAWAQLEKLQEEGLTKSIGVSNHRVQDIKRILASGKVKPAVNQIELHPYTYKEAKEIIALCHENGIKIEAYSPSATLTSFKGELSCLNKFYWPERPLISFVLL